MFLCLVCLLFLPPSRPTSLRRTPVTSGRAKSEAKAIRQQDHVTCLWCLIDGGHGPISSLAHVQQQPTSSPNAVQGQPFYFGPGGGVVICPSSGLICEINRQMCHFSFLYLSYSKIVREMLASVACHFMCVSKARFVTAVYLASNSFITRKLVGNSNCKQRVALSSLRGQPGSLI